MSQTSTTNSNTPTFKDHLYDIVIGVEIHAQLLTQSKLFCPASTSVQSAANHNISPVSVGEPGALPMLNRQAVAMAIRAGLGLNCKINLFSEWSRKNYFYPDLPKGYQISQFEHPICGEGKIQIRYKESNEDQNYKSKEIGIERIHLEEDAGKSIHEGGNSLMNYNRASVPLIETVSKPDMRSSREVVAYAKKVRQIFMYLGICDGNMEEGSFRCDINVSIKPKTRQAFGTRVELKNINSFRFIERAIEYEVLRQQEIIEAGGSIHQETRMYDSTANKTFSLRSKEEANDYRYFPEPDLPYLQLQPSELEIQRASLPELPDQKAERFKQQFGLSEYDAEVLTVEQDLSKYFEDACQQVARGSTSLAQATAPKAIANWVMGDVSRIMNEKQLSIAQLQKQFNSGSLAELVQLVEEQVISGKIAKQVFEHILKEGGTPRALVEQKGWAQISDPQQLEAWAKTVIEKNPGPLEKYKAGNQKLFGFFVGQMMQLSQGKANPELSNEILTKLLGIS